MHAPRGLGRDKGSRHEEPDLEAIVRLLPDLVVANAEENLAVDIDTLRSIGIRVWARDILTVDQAMVSIERLLCAVGVADTPRLNQARSAWARTPTVMPGRRLRAVVPIWRRPWMHVGADTYAGDVLLRLGVDNVLADSVERYSKLPLGELPDSDLVVLPDEPYPCTADDGPEALPGIPCALISGRFLT